MTLRWFFLEEDQITLPLTLPELLKYKLNPNLRNRLIGALNLDKQDKLPLCPHIRLVSILLGVPI